jgi:hypothetical protein
MARAPQISYGRIDTLTIKKSIGKFNKTYHERMKRLMRGSVRAFVKTAASIVHVDTGMSGASLQPLAQEVGTGILGTLKGGKVRKGQTSMAGRYYRNRQRSIAEGIKAGMRAYKLSYGTVQRPRMFLRFETKVYQYALWEGRLWDSLTPAVEAMVNYIYDNFDRYFPDAEFADLIYPKQEIGKK